MLKHVRFAVPTLLIALLAATHAAPASAAPSSWSFVDVGLHVEQGQSLLLVSGDLPKDVPLPHEAELAVPAGMQLQWIGEILGGPPAEDPQLTYVKTTAGDMDIYTFTLTKSRTAQIEGLVLGVTGVAGEIQTSALTWTAWQDLPSVRLSQRVQRGSQVVQASEGASMQPGDETYSRYSKTVTNAKAGDVIDLTFSYALPTAAPSAGTPQAGADTIVLVFLGAAALFLFGIVLVSVRQTAAMSPSEPTAQTAPLRSSPSVPQASTPAKATSAGPAPRVGLLRPQLLIPGGLVMILVIAVSALGSGGSVSDGRITKFFGSTSPCSATSFTLMPNPGVDLAEQGRDIVDAFAGFDDIGDVTLTIETSTLDVTYCESGHTEDSIRQIVEGTGLVTVAAAPAVSAPVTAAIDPSGAKQTATVDTSAGTFDPGTVILKAGLPGEITFGAASGCLTEVVFSSLGITQDLTAGAMTVTLPALESGTYSFACAMGHQAGSIVVQ